MKQIWIRIWPLALTSCVNLGVCACLFAQPCPPFCDPMDGGLPGSSLHGDSPGKNTGDAEEQGRWQVNDSLYGLSKHWAIQFQKILLLKQALWEF